MLPLDLQTEVVNNSLGSILRCLVDNAIKHGIHGCHKLSLLIIMQSIPARALVLFSYIRYCPASSC